jgi:VWFA-related protein
LAQPEALPALQGQTSQAPSGQEIPDAPTPQVPPPEAERPPSSTPPDASEVPPAKGEQPAPARPPAPAQKGQAQDPNFPGPNEPEPGSNAAAKNPPPGGGTQGDNSQDQLTTLYVNSNQVVIPVRVTDGSGRKIEGLAAKDFTVYEDGKKEKLNFFASDPLAVSAAVIFDLGMPDVAVQKVAKTFSALQGAFSQFDEISIYTYSSTVSKASDFGAVGKRLTAALNDLQTVRGENNGPVVTSGPLGPQGPTVNGIPVDPGAPIVSTPPREAHVLNDAILAAALDLSRRDKVRRRLIFVISNGREAHSQASYKDVLKVLLTDRVTVYGVAVEASALPVYDKVEKIHLPYMGYSNILPKYASATAGEVYPEFSSSSIENVYARAIEDARNQYTLGYMARASTTGTYRQLEVRVARPSVKVYAMDGYYSLPPKR